MTDEDQELVALIDNELDEDRKNRLLARLEEDPALRARYEALRDAGAPIGAAFDALLAQAPVARLSAALPPETAVRRGAGTIYRDGFPAARGGLRARPPGGGRRAAGSHSGARRATTTIGARRSSTT